MADVRSGRRFSIALASVAAFVVVAAACAPSPRVRALYEKVTGSTSYLGIVERETRTREVHDGVDTKLILSATRLSPAWHDAFAEEYTNVYYIDRERTEKTTAEWKSASESADRFFVSLFTPDDRLNDLEKPGTLWSIRLVGAGEKEVAPSSVKPTGMRREEIARFFPHAADAWFRCYEVSFPKGSLSVGVASAPKDATPSAKLVLTGVLGRAVLSWE